MLDIYQKQKLYCKLISYLTTKECIFCFNIHSLIYFILIIFLDNSFILSDRVCSFPSILTSKYILRVIGKPTEAIRFCKSNSIKYTPFKTYKDKSYAT